MHIALVHNALIPPPKYGGTERIVYWLGKALVSLGHSVTLLARPGSRIDGAEFIAIDTSSPTAWEDQLPAKVDVVHLWGTPGQPPKRPFVVTIQGNGKPGESFHPNTVFISGVHARNHGSEIFVYNGIDPEEYPCDPQREETLVFLAKASWKVKNLQGAIEIARASGRRLEVLGSRDWPLRIQRLLPAWKGVKFRGMVGDIEKRQVLRRSSALLFPVRWPEPFGIAITEALASGCFVLGTPYGSLPEIISPDVGVVSNDADVLLSALKTANFSPQKCRQRVYEGFSHLDMARSYLGHYETVLNKGILSEQTPAARFSQSAETLLAYGYLAGRV